MVSEFDESGLSFPGGSERSIAQYRVLAGKAKRIIDKNYYELMSKGGMACYQAVAMSASRLASQISMSEFPFLEYYNAMFNFDPHIQDRDGNTHAGQVMLRLQLPYTKISLVLDVAGYLFKFPYKEMSVVSGSLEDIAVTLGQRYSTKFKSDITARYNRYAENWRVI